MEIEKVPTLGDRVDFIEDFISKVLTSIEKMAENHQALRELVDLKVLKLEEDIAHLQRLADRNTPKGRV